MVKAGQIVIPDRLLEKPDPDLLAQGVERFLKVQIY
jgi:hypothetical protein